VLNFITLGQPLLGEKYVARKRKERKIITNIVDTSFHNNAQGQRTHSTRTNTAGLPPWVHKTSILDIQDIKQLSLMLNNLGWIGRPMHSLQNDKTLYLPEDKAYISYNGQMVCYVARNMDKVSGFMTHLYRCVMQPGEPYARSLQHNTQFARYN
jgi:hypothetical protein